MKDYEQLYFDSQYEIKKLKKRIEELEETIYLQQELGENKDLKFQLIKVFKEYMKGVKKDEKM